MIARVRYSESFGNESVDVMELGNKARRALYNRHINTMEDVMDNWDRLSLIKGVGEKTVKEIKVAFIKAYGQCISDAKQIEFLERIANDNPITKEEAV